MTVLQLANSVKNQSQTWNWIHCVFSWRDERQTCCVPCANMSCILYIHTYVHTYIHTHTYMHTHTHTYINTYIHTHTYIHTYIHKHIHTYIHAYIFTYILTYIHIYIHTHIRGGAHKSLARPTSQCRRTESIVSLLRGVCSCAELQVFSCYRGWKEACQATHAISTTSRSSCQVFFSCKARRRRKFTQFWQKH